MGHSIKSGSNVGMIRPAEMQVFCLRRFLQKGIHSADLWNMVYYQGSVFIIDRCE